MSFQMVPRAPAHRHFRRKGIKLSNLTRPTDAEFVIAREPSKEGGAGGEEVVVKHVCPWDRGELFYLALSQHLCHRGPFGSGEGVNAGAHVEVEALVEVHVLPEQRRQHVPQPLGCGTRPWTVCVQRLTRSARVYRKEGTFRVICVGLCAGQP